MDFMPVVEICRTCLKNKESTISIFNVADSSTKLKFSDMLFEIASIRALENDRLPTKVCTNCAGEMKNCYEFKKKCLESQEKLMQPLDFITEKDLVSTNTSDHNELSVINEETDDNPKELVQEKSSNQKLVTNKRLTCPFCSKEFKKKNIFFQHVHMHKVKKEPENCTNEIESNLEENSESSMPCNESVSSREPSPLQTVEEDHSYTMLESKPVAVKSEQNDDATHDENFVKCVRCDDKFVNIADFWDHVAKVHPDSTIIQSEEYKNGKRMEKKVAYYCKNCNIVFLQKANFSRHMKVHTSQRTCPYCDTIFQSQQALQVHEKRFHKKIYKCSTCQATFERRHELITHRNSSHKKDPHLCPTCGKAFTDKGNLNAHMRIHSGEKPYVCQICAKAFTQWAALNLHKAMHSDERNFVCTTCGNKYKRRSALLSHMQKHTGQKNYGCAVCDKKFYSRTHLKDHSAKHTGEKNHICNTCGKAFSRKKTLTVHYRSHTGERPHVCTVCGRAFIQRVVLRSHMKTHQQLLAEPPFQ